MLQAYLCKWGIEVKLKEQKTILACRKAQVRTEESCQIAPTFHVAIYNAINRISKKILNKRYQDQNGIRKPNYHPEPQVIS